MDFYYYKLVSTKHPVTGWSSTFSTVVKCGITVTIGN